MCFLERFLKLLFNSLIIFLLFITPIYSEDYVLFDSADMEVSWEILPDGFINPVQNNNSRTIAVTSERYGNVSGILLEFSEINTLSYYIVKPDIDIQITDLNYLKYLEITIYSNYYNLGIGILFEENSGKNYEIFLGRLDFDGWRILTAYTDIYINGLNFKGIVIYNNPERDFPINSRVLYIKQIIADGE